ncbi:hypothetical protein M2G99_21590 [Vibrio vulnificus]|nr:hypothetical protein [Vibrio vulnificus]
MRKVGLCGIHPLTQRYVAREKGQFNEETPCGWLHIARCSRAIFRRETQWRRTVISSL